MKTLFTIAAFACGSCAADPLSGDALYADVERYAAFGIHQTGSEGDRLTAGWLESELRGAGFDVDTVPFTFRRFELSECSLVIDGAPVDSFPFWFPRQTPEEGITGALRPYDDEADLRGAVVFVPREVAGRAPYFSSVNAWAESAADRGAIACAVEVQSGSGNVAAINAVDPYVEQPLPIPCAIVGSESRAAIDDAMHAGASATLRIRGVVHEDAVAENVVGRIIRGPRWLVVTTPSSGWFACAGERGPGIALFLGLARALAAGETDFSLLFIANSGHELDALGARASLDSVAPPPAEVLCWIHLGASIATRRWETGDSGATPVDEPEPLGNLAGVEAFVPMLSDAFSDVPWLTPRSDGPIAGELEHFIDAGYPALGFFGPHFYFHTRFDTPESTSPELLAIVGEGLRRFVHAL